MTEHAREVEEKRVNIQIPRVLALMTGMYRARLYEDYLVATTMIKVVMCSNPRNDLD